MDWLRRFFTKWGMRCAQGFGTLLVFGPLINFIGHAVEDRIDTTAEWLWALAALLVPLAFGKWWFGLFDVHDVPVQQSPAEERAARLLEVADSVTSLPGGLEFSDLCRQLNEKETRQLLHRLHQIRPGERHLRAVVPKM